MTAIEKATASASLARTGTVVDRAADALRKRRTRAEAQGRKRKTTRDVYIDAWINFSAFMVYQRASSKVNLKAWLMREYIDEADRERSKRAWLDRLDGQLADVNHHDVQAYKLAMLNQPGRRGVGLAKSTVTVRLAALTHLFKIALREGVVEYNPASSDFVDRERDRGRKHKHVLSLDEVKLVLGLPLESVIDVRNRFLFKLLAWTGMRRQEASELFVGDLVEEPEGMLITLRRKGDKEDVILAPSGLEADLYSYGEDLGIEGPLFPSMKRLPHGAIQISRTAIVPDTITHIIRDMTSQALGQGYGPHRLRHFFANAVWDKGGSIETIQQYLGHEDPKTTRGYLELKPRRDRSAAELIDLD